MKVVLFCGGQGLRIQGYAGRVPKPLVPIGCRPILWHVMKYYAHFGHTDFILCLGHYGEVIRNYFYDYDTYISCNVLSHTEDQLPRPVASDAEDWNITLVDTGKDACIGERLQAVQPLLAGDDVFLANYADGVTDLHLPTMIGDFCVRDATACFLNVKPFYSFHVAKTRANGTVQALTDAAKAGLRINGGFFVLTREIFDYMEPGDELVEEPFQRLIREQKLIAYEHDGFWGCMDTFKEKVLLEKMHLRGEAPWELWRSAEQVSGASPVPERSISGGEGGYHWGRKTLDAYWGEQVNGELIAHKQPETHDQP